MKVVAFISEKSAAVEIFTRDGEYRYSRLQMAPLPCSLEFRKGMEEAAAGLLQRTPFLDQGEGEAAAGRYMLNCCSAPSDHGGVHCRHSF